MYWNYWMGWASCWASGLTLTWDVLKWWTACNGIWDRGRLTLTWDVLKSWSITKGGEDGKGLTLTWDVLKFWHWFWNGTKNFD